MTVRRRRPPLGALLTLLALSCGSGGAASGYPTPPLDEPLGASWDPGTLTTTFRVWAPAAGQVSVLFFADAAAPNPSATYALTQDLGGGGVLDARGWNGVWTGVVNGVPRGQLYQYAIDGARVLDPYAQSMGRFDGSSGAAGRGAVLDAAAIRPRDLGTLGEPEQDMVPFARPAAYGRREDAVIYEVHVRDFTMRLTQGAGPGQLVHLPGTYTAFTERLAHVRDLGATHVELLPVLAYYYGEESKRATFEAALTTTNHNYNWGYDPQSWFAPEGMYSADPTDPALRVQELKTLVNEAHKQGLGVILDVVFNHTATTSILSPFAPGYFYRSGSNSSGTGNDTASERRMMRRLVVDSIRHWTRAYQVDGFRFDLMGLLDSKTIGDAYAAAAAVKPDVLFIGEGWRMSGVPSRDDLGDPIVAANQDWMASTDVAAVFSDSIRDLVKGGGFGEGDDANSAFLTGRAVDEVALLRNLRGDPTNFTADVPGDVVQYLTAHDGLTLHDKIGKILRLPPGSAEIPKVARLGFVLLATSQGIVFLHGGCEFGRTKQVPTLPGDPNATSANSPGDPGLSYVFNSYDSSDAVNAFDWALDAAGTSGKALDDYVAGLLALRRSSSAFHLADKATAAAKVTLLDGSQGLAIAYRLVDAAGTTRYSVFVNAGIGTATLATGDDLTGAEVVVDSDEAGATPVTAPSGFSALTASSVAIAPRTAVIFRAPMP